MSVQIQALFFPTSFDFRAWLEINHILEKELLVGFYKVHTGVQSITWSESVDEALCFGWIDGVRKSIDKDRYCIRFSPRKTNSIWSAINIKKVETLTSKGLMKKEGLAIFSLRKEANSRIYAYENEGAKFSIEFENEFKSNSAAWAYFHTLAPSYKKSAINWVMSAKQEVTRIRRLKLLIADSENNKK